MPERDELELSRAFANALGMIETAHLAIAHPLGFLMLAQIPGETGGYSRLHLWERLRMRPEIPHSHSGDLRSTILAGRLANTPWRPTEDRGRPVSVVAVRKDARNVRRYRSLGRGTFAADAPRSYVAGESYFIEAGAFHSSECLSELAITVVERSPSLAEPARIAIAADLPLDRRRRIALPAELRLAALSLLRAERDRLGLG